MKEWEASWRPAALREGAWRQEGRLAPNLGRWWELHSPITCLRITHKLERPVSRSQGVMEGSWYVGGAQGQQSPFAAR
jgi:hypothetical protein